MKVNDSLANFALQRNLIPRDTHESGSVRSAVATPEDSELQKADSSIHAVNQSGKTADLSAEKNKDMDKQVDDALDKANQFFQSDNRSLQFVRDKDSDKFVILIKDMKTDEVIRQIPSEAMLKLAKQLEQVKGMLFEDKA